MSLVKPIITWIGNKQYVRQHIVDVVPKEIMNYFEPFVGGCSILLSVLQSDVKIMGDVVVSDSNFMLIQMYKDIQERCEEFIAGFDIVRNEFNNAEDKKGMYENIKTEYNIMLKSKTANLRSSVLFIMLNKTGFNHIYRESAKNGYNIPMGKNNTFVKDIADDIREFRRVVQNVCFITEKFEAAFERIKQIRVHSHDVPNFLYLDPPYVPIKGLSDFTMYTADNFSCHSSLFTEIEELRKLGVVIAMSNSDTSDVRESFVGDSWIIKEIAVRYRPSIGNRELLIVSKK